MITEEQWIQEKLEAYKLDPQKITKELLVNTNDAINQFFKQRGSQETFDLLMNACILNNKLLAEIKKWDDENQKPLLVSADGKSELTLISLNGSLKKQN